ncbi:hypothetical protein SCUCBS95973_006791 [Sporothrix curviconia]|uniref:Mob1 family protein n=1 Tax=Sporothrix curviconia TaxID=1260050 RepID=A0ABP0C827_9PEZI
MAVPPSSPRLPSPPPAAEIQIGPKSPAASGATLAQQQMEQQMEQSILDANAKRRIHPGTRAADFAVGPPLVPLNELDSAFQFQEHLAALHYHHTGNNTVPINRETALLLAQAPPGADRTMWLYELCRFLIAQCNSLIVGFLFDTPACSAVTCPEMRASEWQFLCAVHEQPRSCCAIDYCCHTLDWAANVVTNPKIFPSRFVFADAHDQNAAVKNLINVFRRLHRIFAHAWFQHRGVFWSVEAQTGLYVFFKTVCDMYDLLPAENYKLPPEAEGLNAAASSLTASAGATPATEAPTEAAAPGLIPVSSIADRKSLGLNTASAGPAGERPAQRPGSGPGINGTGGGGGGGTGLAADLLGGDSEHLHSIGRTNTRRHIRSSPSTGSAVTTVMEQDEDASSSSAMSFTAAGRPISILQNSRATRPQQSHTSPLVTEKEVSESDNEADAAASGGNADASTTSVPIIVEENTRQDQSTAAPSGQDAVDETLETPTAATAADKPPSETASTEASDPIPEEPAEAVTNAAEDKQAEEEPAEPVTIIVAGELAEAGRRAAAAASMQGGLPKEEPSTAADVPEAAEAAEETDVSEKEAGIGAAAEAESTVPSVAEEDGENPATTEEEAPTTTTTTPEDETAKAAEDAPEEPAAAEKDKAPETKAGDTEAAETEPKPEAEVEAEAKPAPED